MCEVGGGNNSGYVFVFLRIHACCLFSALHSDDFIYHYHFTAVCIYIYILRVHGCV